jgi:hypothetical protein
MEEDLMPKGVYERSIAHRRKLSEQAIKSGLAKKNSEKDKIDKMVTTKLLRVLQEKNPVIPQNRNKTPYEYKRSRRDAILEKMKQIIDVMKVGDTFDTLSMRKRLGKVRGHEVERTQLRVYIREFPQIKYHHRSNESYYEVVE